MSRFPKISNTIRGAIKRAGHTDMSFSRETGIPYQTLQTRFRDPGSWRLCEWGSMLRHISFTEEDLQIIRKEVNQC